MKYQKVIKGRVCKFNDPEFQSEMGKRVQSKIDFAKRNQAVSRGKKGRSILFKTDFRNSETNQDLFLKATNKYYRGIIINTEIVDQFKSSSLNEATSNNTLTYTEPLGKKDFIVFDYGL